MAYPFRTIGLGLRILRFRAWVQLDYITARSIYDRDTIEENPDSQAYYSTYSWTQNSYYSQEQRSLERRKSLAKSSRHVDGQKPLL